MVKPILGWAFEAAFWTGIVMAIVILFGTILVLLSGIMVIWLGF